MKSHEIKKGIYWVGGIDWDVRNFHGYSTPQGTTYNAYLIVDEKVVLIDTVKKELFDKMLHRVSEFVDPSKIDMIISNHAEMDHSGGIAQMLEHAPNAKVYASKQGEKALMKHFDNSFPVEVVKTGDELSIGKRTLKFISTPLLHWPDSMATYCPEEKILFSNDAFGQHWASAERYDYELSWGVLREAAAKYYANIILPYCRQAEKAVTSVSELEFDMICPSHGLIWKDHVKDILAEYDKWAHQKSENKAVIIYDTMWGSTDKLAFMLQRGLEDEDVKVSLRNLRFNHISDLMTEILETRMIILGSPVLNNCLLPTMGAFLTYLKGLKPKGKIGFAMGSYGWNDKIVQEINDIMSELNWEVPYDLINVKYVPDGAELDHAYETGRKLGCLMNDSEKD